MLHSAGCKKEEIVIPPRLAKETVVNTNNRRIKVEQKPRMKNLFQTLRFPRKKLTTLPRKMKKNQIEHEKRDRAEHRLKLKIRSFFIQQE
jgi:hypothetical protein